MPYCFRIEGKLYSYDYESDVVEQLLSVAKQLVEQTHDCIHNGNYFIDNQNYSVSLSPFKNPDSKSNTYKSSPLITFKFYDPYDYILTPTKQLVDKSIKFWIDMTKKRLESSEIPSIENVCEIIKYILGGNSTYIVEKVKFNIRFEDYYLQMFKVEEIVHNENVEILL